MKDVRVLILEPYASGHHGPYLNWIVGGLAHHGVDATVVTLRESLDHPSVKSLVNSLAGNSERIPRILAGSSLFLPSIQFRGSAGLLVREIAYWRLLRRWYRDHVEVVRPDIVFVPYLDYCLYAIGLLGSPFGPHAWAGICMRPAFHYREMGVVAPRPSFSRLKERLFLRLLGDRHLRCLLTIDAPLGEYFATNAKLKFLQEPGELSELPSRSDAKLRLGIPADRKVILVYGQITPRKGAGDLLRAMVSPRFPPAADVVFAGPLSPEVHQLVGEQWAAELVGQKRVRLLDRHIGRADEAALFAAANIVWLGYRGHYTSSCVLIQAGYAGRPVIACREGIIGWLARRHGLGPSVDPSNAAEVVGAVSSLLNTPPNQAQFVELWREATSFSEAQSTLAHALCG